MCVMCKRCLLHTGVPNVTLNSDGLCDVCARHDGKEKEYARRFAAKKFLNMIEEIKRENRRHDCIVMLSGGKDSTYLLDLMLNEYGLKVLAVSVFHPLMNEIAKQNVRDTAAQRNVDLLEIHASERDYRLIMKHGIVHSDAYSLDEFFGCYLCSNFFKWLIVQQAMEMNISLILDGSDRSQTEEPYFIDAKRWNRSEAFMKRPLGTFHDIVSDALGSDYERSTYYFDPEVIKEKFPTIVAPLTFMEHQRDAVKEKRMNKIFTNCDAVPFFSLFTLRKFDCVPYIRHYANELRNGYSNILQLRIDHDFQGTMSREMFRKILEEYKTVIFAVVEKGYTKESITQKDRDGLIAMVPTYVSIFGEEVCLSLLDSVLKITDYFTYFGISR